MAPGRGGPPPREDLIDRNPRNIPLPISGFAPVRQKRRPPGLLKFWRRNAAVIVTALGLLGALVGALITISQPPVPVYSAGGGIHVGSTVLTHPADNGGLPADRELFTGTASYILRFAPDGTEKAAAVTLAHGGEVTGSCVMAPPAADRLTEHCTFTVEGKALSSDDVLLFDRSGYWSRTYGDGATVRIGVPSQGGAVPVPFPIGK
jgi:hypothetical protein